LPHPGLIKERAKLGRLKMTFYFNKPEGEINIPIWIFKGLVDWQSEINKKRN